MVIISWDKYGMLLIDYLPHGTKVNGFYYASTIERLRSAILEKRWGKVSSGVLLHDNAPVHKYNIGQAAIQLACFTERNHSVHSLDIAPRDCHLFSNLKKILRGKKFNSGNETISTIEDYSYYLNSNFFCQGIESSNDRWLRMVASNGHYVQ